jgi:hypothetical protein
MLGNCPKGLRHFTALEQSATELSGTNFTAELRTFPAVPLKVTALTRIQLLLNVRINDVKK